MNYYLGVDIGSINVKIALVDESGKIHFLAARKIVTSPRAALNSLIEEVDHFIISSSVTAVGVSGSGKAIVPPEFKWTEYSSSLAIASGLLHAHPDVRTIIQIGGQSSMVIELDGGLEKPWKVVSNPLCAAGTGRFLEQQCYRLGIRIEDFGDLALRYNGTPPRIAARCSVFAKSDLIHLQQKGVSVEAMLCGLSESIARMVVSLKKGVFNDPVYFVGGVASNGAIIKALSNMISTRNGSAIPVIVPANFLNTEAIGTALLARRNSGSKFGFLPDETEGKRYFDMPPLQNIDYSR